MIDAVVKVGGGLLAYPADFDRVLVTIGRTAARRRLLVVPGGGPFADAVRRVYRQMNLSEDAAHWMAVLAMDQCAHLIASRTPGGVVVASASDFEAMLDSGQIPVLAPTRWLQEVDPLPHTWDVTSDSIAAWIASSVNADHLILIKPPRASGSSLVDAHFVQTLAPRLRHSIVPADQIDVLASTLAGCD
jgi:aspartokinase-like uncharacterized kinase